MTVSAMTMQEALDLYKTQVAARENCEAQCNTWHEWFGEMMRMYRREKGVKALLIARQVGITRSYLAMLERGKRRWSEELIRKYCEAVG